MENKTKLLAISYFIVLISCAERKPIDSEFGSVPELLKGVFTEIGSKKQSFTILPTVSNTIVGKEGTIVLIPKESIADLAGEVIEDSVILSIKEHFNLSDYILSNLQTVSDTSILVSRGMIYINATDKSGNDLKIVKGKNIRLEIPNQNNDNADKIFVGQRDEDGSISWTLPIEQTKTLIPLPIRFISKNRFPTECLDFYGITKDTLNKQHYNYYGDVEKYENTLLATKEFRDRFSWYCWKEVLQIYIDNLDKNMWEIDEMVVKHLKRDSAERVKWSQDNPPPMVDGNPITKDQWNAHKSLVEMGQEASRMAIETFEFFASQKLTKIDPTQIVDTSKIGDINKAFISYSALDFGWVNVDFFFDDPRSIPIKMIARTNTPATLINLIIKNRKVILTGFEKGNNEYSFTKNDDGYNKLPKGDTAIILGIGIKDNNIVFDKSELVIGQKEIINLNLKKIEGSELKEILEKMR